MSMCALGGGTDFKCPSCKEDLTVYEWHTEYGDPCVGENDVWCPFCKKEFTLLVYVETTYKVMGERD